MSLSTAKKQEIIEEFGRTKDDTGSPEVQVALLTERISQLTEHLRKHKKDYDTRRSLLILVNRRSKLLKYIKSKDETAYQDMVAKLGIREKPGE